MENASKALVMAGEILVAVLVLGLVAYIVFTFGSFSANVNKQIEENKVIEFNNHFTVHDGKIDITADDILSVINFAKYSNESYDIDMKNTVNSPFYVDVIIEGVGSIFKTGNPNDFQKRVSNFINNNNTVYYKCNVSNITVKNQSPKKVLTRTIKDNRNYTTGDIIVDSASKGTGLVTSIKFYKTNISDFSSITRDNYTIV